MGERMNAITPITITILHRDHLNGITSRPVPGCGVAENREVVVAEPLQTTHDIARSIDLGEYVNSLEWLPFGRGVVAPSPQFDLQWWEISSQW